MQLFGCGMDNWDVTGCSTGNWEEKSRYVLRIRDYFPTFLFFSDGIGTQKFLFDREEYGFLGSECLALTTMFGTYHNDAKKLMLAPWLPRK